MATLNDETISSDETSIRGEEEEEHRWYLSATSVDHSVEDLPLTTGNFMVAVRGYCVHLFIARSVMKSVSLWGDKASDEDAEDQRYTHRARSQPSPHRFLFIQNQFALFHARWISVTGCSGLQNTRVRDGRWNAEEFAQWYALLIAS